MSFRHFLGLLALLALLMPAVAAPPAWWATGNPPIITGSETNNRGPANIGQAKWMVAEALRALDITAPYIASKIRTDLAGTAPAFTDSIIDLTVPTPKTAEWIEKQKAPLLVGQLKAIARPFYNHFNTLGYAPWISGQIRRNFATPAVLGTDFWRATGNSNYTENGFYPWNPDAPMESNSAVATIGQLKLIFSFDLTSTLPPSVSLWTERAYVIGSQGFLRAQVRLNPFTQLQSVRLNGQLLPTQNFNVDEENSLSVNLVDGLNRFSIEVTDSNNNVGVATTTITRSDNSKPVVVITSPKNGAKIKITPPLDVSFSISGTIDSVVPIRSVYAVNKWGRPETFSIIDARNFSGRYFGLQLGINIITVTAVDVLGKSGTATVKINCRLPGTIPPEVALFPSVPYTTGNTATLFARVTLDEDEGATLLGLKLNGLSVPAASSYPVSLVDGINTFTLEATDSYGKIGSSTTTIIRDTALPQVAITSPASNATIAASFINVVGTASSRVPIRSVAVNGVSAYVNGNSFEVPNIPLNIGSNTVTATAIDVLDKVSTSSITVIGQPPNPLTSVTVSATPSVGVAPFTVQFDVAASVPGIIESVIYDLEGNGLNLSTANSIVPVVHLYSRAGIFFPRVTVRTNVGMFSNRTGPGVPLAERLRIEVKGAPGGGGDSPLVAWSNLKKCVARGDFEAAGNCLSSKRREGYKAMLIKLGPSLAPTMLDNFGELQQITLDEYVASYVAEISTPDGVVSFLVDCIKEDGKWKIFSF